MFDEEALIALLVVSILCGIGSAVTAWVAFRKPVRKRRIFEDNMRQLQIWQDRKLLVLHDQTTVDLLSRLGETDPHRLRSLVKDIQRMMEDHELGPGDTIILTIRP